MLRKRDNVAYVPSNLPTSALCVLRGARMERACVSSPVRPELARRRLVSVGDAGMSIISSATADSSTDSSASGELRRRFCVWARAAVDSGVRQALGPAIASYGEEGCPFRAFPHPNPNESEPGTCCSGLPALNGIGGGGGVAMSNGAFAPERHAMLGGRTQQPGGVASPFFAD